MASLISLPAMFRRLRRQPIDSTNVQADYAAALAYAATATAYPGQRVSTITPPKLYLIASDYSLVEVTSPSSGRYHIKHGFMHSFTAGEVLFSFPAALAHRYYAGLTTSRFGVVNPPTDGDVAFKFYVGLALKATINVARYTGAITVDASSDFDVNVGDIETWVAPASVDSGLYGFGVDMIGVEL